MAATDYGMDIINTSGRIQVGGDLGNPRLIQRGTINPAVATKVTMPYKVDLEPPLVLVKPSAPDVWVGGFSIQPANYVSGSYNSGPTGAFGINGTGSFEYAIFACQGTATSDGATYGLEVYRSNGTVAYSSRHQHPRITQLFTRPIQTPQPSGGYPTTFALSGFTSMPWILVNPLLVTSQGVGEFTEAVGAVFAKINSSFTVMTIDILNVAMGTPTTWNSAQYNKDDFNPYGGQRGYFGVGTFN